MSTPAPEKRQCYWIPAQPWKDTGKWVPFLVTEDDPWPKPFAGNGESAQPWFWGDSYPEAKRHADEMNLADFGITEAQMAEILFSSLRAQRREQASA